MENRGLPWSDSGNATDRHIVDKEGLIVGFTNTFDRGDADMILHCVNHYAETLDLLKKLQGAHDVLLETVASDRPRTNMINHTKLQEEACAVIDTAND